MDRIDVHLGAQIVGTALILKEGLYYRVKCQCRLPGDAVYSLIAESADKQERLGVCVPEGDGFGLKTRIPIKRLGEGPISLRVISRKEETTGTFILLDPEKPFPCLEKLSKATLQLRNSNVGIFLSE